MSSKTARPQASRKQGNKKQNQQRQAQQAQQAQQPRQAQSAPGAQPLQQTQPARTRVGVSNADVQAAQTAKREARLERQAAARAAAQSRRRKKMMQRYAIITAGLIVLLGVAIAMLVNEANKPGESVSAMAVRNHLGPGEAYAGQYNTDPPTNGPHSEQVPEFKVYSEPITKELAVHGLEDGGVIINYKPDLDKTTVDNLAAIATTYIEQTGGRSHVVMAPYPNLSHPIVLTAWRRIDRLDTLDEPRIRRFINEYVGIDHHEGSEGRRLP